MGQQKYPVFTDDAKEPIGHLLKDRLPWLTLGLLGGIGVSVFMSQFESILQGDIRLAFFIPIIVYMSDAIGAQTEIIYVRHLKQTGVGFWRYLMKETGLGLSLGLIFGIVTGLFAGYWLKAPEVALTVGLAMFVNVTLAPILATVIPRILYLGHSDPALGSGPLATLAQDAISLLVYFLIATLIIF